MHVTKLRIRRVYVVAREVSAEKRRYRRYRSAHASQSSIQNTTSCSGQRIADRRRCDRRANENEASVLKRARNRWCHFLFFFFFFQVPSSERLIIYVRVPRVILYKCTSLSRPYACIVVVFFFFIILRSTIQSDNGRRFSIPVIVAGDRIK